jgi:hypothetical protein
MALYAVSGLQAGVADVPESATPAVNPAQKDSIDHEIMLADQALDSFDAEKEGMKALQMVAAQQKSVVSSMVSVATSTETAIAASLAGSIDAYSRQIETINGWTVGGIEMFDSALDVMFESIKEGGVTGTELEDLFQLAIMDYMAHSDTNPPIPQDIEAAMYHYLESTGTGSHGVHEGWTANKSLSQ